MNDRVIRHDKNGVYIIADRRRFRPAAPTTYKKGDKVTVAYYGQGINWHDDKTKIVVQTRVQYPVGHAKNPGRGYPMMGYENIEVWECHDADPRIKEQLKSGFHKFVPVTHGGFVTVVVAGDDGYNYNSFRKDPTGYKPHISRKSTRGVNVHLHVSQSTSGHVQFDWDKWDKLVAEVNSQRDAVQIAPIAMKLQEEVDLDDQLQEYIQEKGLTNGQA